MTRRRDVTATRLVVLLLATAVALGLPAAALAQSQSGFQYNGIVHVSWWFDEYDSAQALTSRAVLADTGANWMALLVTWYQQDAAANVVARHPDPNKDHSDARVRAAIQDARNRGLQVMLKPHVDAINGQWRGDFNPSNPDAWFQSYTQFIVHYAQIAQQENVQAFAIGTEFKTISGAANRNRWLAVIAAIRNVYSGTLTYAANATFPADEFTSVSFWDQLDVIGLDGYFNLTNLNNPTLQQLISAWTNNRNGENSVAAVQNFASSRGKPVIFTEIGYKSTDRTNVEPWNFGLSGAVDTAEQRDCYQAAFTVWSQQSAWMRGVFWWAWPVPVPAANDGDYNPRSKPAEQVLRTWQGVAGPNFSLSASPASLAINPGASGTASITIARTGFTGSVDLSASGLPSGVTAAFSPDPTTGNASTVTFTAAGTATSGTVNVTINGTGSVGTRSTSLSLTVNAGANFSLSVSPATLALGQGASATRTVTITRSSFTGSVDLSASGLPSGVTATFSPDPTTGNTSTLTLSAAANAAPGTVNVSISGVGSVGTRTTTLALTVTGSDFTLSASPPTLTVNRGASATRAISITRTGGFTGAVDLSASGLPAGVTASFSPDPTTGNTSTLTLTASTTATLGTTNVSVVGTAGVLTRTMVLALTVNGGGGTGGPATVTPSIVQNSPWYRDLSVRLANPGPLTALTVTVVIQRTPGVTYNGMYNTVGGQILQTSTQNTNAATITYTWTLAAGQTLGTGNWQFSAQAGGNGTAHPTTGDTYTANYTTGGQNFTASATFP